MYGRDDFESNWQTVRDETTSLNVNIVIYSKIKLNANKFNYTAGNYNETYAIKHKA